MDKSEIKSIIIVALALCTIILGTCEVRHRLQEPEPMPVIDTLQFHNYKVEKEKEIESYRDKIGRLQQVKDSLWFLAVVSKVEFQQTRPKVKHYQAKLKETLQLPEETTGFKDSLLAVSDSLIYYQDRADSACIETITTLEEVVANRDSSILLYKEVEINLRDIQKAQSLQTQQLTEQLNNAYKAQRKKSRQNKWLAGGLVFISCIATAIIIPHYSK